jgi:hypothetical protein
MSKKFINGIFRGLEKVPGINFGHYMMINGKKVLMFPKCGTRTIRDHYLRLNDIHDKNEGTRYYQYYLPSSFNRINDSNTILFIRSPLDRLFSCWKQKVSSLRDPRNFYFWQYYPILYPGMTFCDFLKAVDGIKGHRAEKHFASFYTWTNTEISDLNIKIYRLDKINEILHVPNDVNKTNMTHSSKLKISDFEMDFYKNKLISRYVYDEELFKLAN